MIQDKPEVLAEMLKDMESAPAIYRPSNYWNNYQRESYRYVNSYGISEFRSHKNILWSSFGAVADPLLGYAPPLANGYRQEQAEYSCQIAPER
jgi:hypothetical protein